MFEGKILLVDDQPVAAQDWNSQILTLTHMQFHVLSETF